jgi:voltage-gated potassium channel
MRELGHAVRQASSHATNRHPNIALVDCGDCFQYWQALQCRFTLPLLPGQVTGMDSDSDFEEEERSVFLLLSVAILLLLVFQPLVDEWPRGEYAVTFFSTLVQLAAIAVLAENPRLRKFAFWFGLPTIVVVWVRHSFTNELEQHAVVAAHGLMAILLACTAFLILRYVVRHQATVDNMIGAVCAYLLIGIVAAQMCFIVETLNPGAYRVVDAGTMNLANPNTRASLMIYYSFSTLTCSGYGDIIPDMPLTRTMAWIEAVIGQFYLVVLVSGMVSIRVSQKEAKRSRTKK